MLTKINVITYISFDFGWTWLKCLPDCWIYFYAHQSILFQKSLQSRFDNTNHKGCLHVKAGFSLLETMPLCFLQHRVEEKADFSETVQQWLYPLVVLLVWNSVMSRASDIKLPTPCSGERQTRNAAARTDVIVVGFQLSVETSTFFHDTHGVVNFNIPTMTFDHRSRKRILWRRAWHIQ